MNGTFRLRIILLLVALKSVLITALAKLRGCILKNIHPYAHFQVLRYAFPKVIDENNKNEKRPM